MTAPEEPLISVKPRRAADGSLGVRLQPCARGYLVVGFTDEDAEPSSDPDQLREGDKVRRVTRQPAHIVPLDELRAASPSTRCY